LAKWLKAVSGGKTWFFGIKHGFSSILLDRMELTLQDVVGYTFESTIYRVQSMIRRGWFK
jgi:hypothetical protein